MLDHGSSSSTEKLGNKLQGNLLTLQRWALDNLSAEQDSFVPSLIETSVGLLSQLLSQTAEILETQDAEIRTLRQRLPPSAEGEKPLPSPRACCPEEENLSEGADLNRRLSALLDKVHEVLQSSSTALSLQSVTTKVSDQQKGEDTSEKAVRDSEESERALSELETEIARIRHELASSTSESPLPPPAPQSCPSREEGYRSSSPRSRCDEPEECEPRSVQLCVASGRQESLEEVKIKNRCLEEMQQGSWFFRVGRRFGNTLGKALKSTFRRRGFVWISSDFRHLYCAATEPVASLPTSRSHQDSIEPDRTKGVGGGSTTKGRNNLVAMPLDNVIGFVYGETSRSYRLQEGRPDNMPPHLCFSVWTKRQALDLVALNEPEVDRWYLGLGSLLPFFPGREYMTPSEFYRHKNLLKRQHYEREQVAQQKRLRSADAQWNDETIPPSNLNVHCQHLHMHSFDENSSVVEDDPILPPVRISPDYLTRKTSKVHNTVTAVDSYNLLGSFPHPTVALPPTPDPSAVPQFAIGTPRF